MLPQNARLVFDDTMDCLECGAKHSGKRLKRVFARCVEASNLGDLRIGQHGIVMALTSRSVAIFRPALRVHVVNVIGICPQEQVGRINAGGIIAMMTDKHTFRDGTVVQFPGNTVGAKGLAAMTPSVYGSVPKFLDGSGPQPAGVGFAHELPEPRLKRGSDVYAIALAGRVLRGIIKRHSDLHSRCVKSQGVDASLAQLIGVNLLYHSMQGNA